MAIGFALVCASCLVVALLRRRDPSGGARAAASGAEHDRKAVRFRATATTELRDLRQWWPMFVPAFFPLVMLLFAGNLALYVTGVALLGAAAWVTARDSERWWRGKGVRVGSDGVCIETPQASRFIPFTEVAAMDRWSVLVLRSSEELRLVADPRDAASLYLRLVQAIARSRSHRAKATRVRTFVTAGAGAAYRSDAMTSDEALEVLEDPTALEDQRVASATWLAHAPDRDTVVHRLRAIVDETASARVRAAVAPLISGCPRFAPVEG